MIDFEHHFPTIWAACQEVGLDPERDWLPVAPAAHYMSGGVVTDLDGATTLPHLWACGETACSGVHGANRLASNSLLDGLVFGRRVVGAIADRKAEAAATGAMRGVLDVDLDGGTARDSLMLSNGPHEPVADPGDVRGSLQRVMSADCGVVRDAEGLRHASETLARLSPLAGTLPSRAMATYEVRNLLRVSREIVATALARLESRGSHTRRDFPRTPARCREPAYRPDSRNAAPTSRCARAIRRRRSSGCTPSIAERRCRRRGRRRTHRRCECTPRTRPSGYRTSAHPERRNYSRQPGIWPTPA